MSELEPPMLNTEPSAPVSVEYELLKGHFRTDGSYKNDEQLRTEYVQLTDSLVHQMVDGVEVVDPVTKEKHLQKPDVVVWLDKSARPLSWLTKELWPTIAADAEGNVPDMPEFRFVNIDREQWVNTVDPDGSGSVDIDKVDKSIIRSLRSIFIAPEHKSEGLTEDIDEAPTQLDGKTVLIVDEVKASGRTLDIATKFFQRSFPTTKVSGTHWMRAVTQLAGSVGNADLPVWYKEADERGRGVGNRDERLSRRSPSSTQRLGAWFLSTRFSGEDSSSRQLRQEFHRLAGEVADHTVLFLPSTDRDIDDWEERATRINELPVDKVLQEKSELILSNKSRILF